MANIFDPIVWNKIKNLEFNIAFCETNLRYLYQWDSKNKRAIKINKKAIRKAKIKIYKIKHES